MQLAAAKMLNMNCECEYEYPYEYRVFAFAFIHFFTHKSDINWAWGEPYC